MRASLVLRSLHFLASTIFAGLLGASAEASTTQLVLSRDARPEGMISGVVDLTVSPGFDGARVTVVVDGQKLTDGLRSPYHVTVDFGPTVVEHKISVIAYSGERKRVQWHDTINQGHLPLTIKLTPIDVTNRVFEASVTSPQNDPVEKVEFWDGGKVIASLNMPTSYVILDRVVWGVSALLGRLEATNNWRGILSEYRKGTPPCTELGRIEAAWRRP